MEQTIELFGMRLKVVEDDSYFGNCTQCVFYNKDGCGCTFNTDYACLKEDRINRHFEKLEDSKMD